MGKLAIGEGRPYVDQNAKTVERTPPVLCGTFRKGQKPTPLFRRTSGFLPIDLLTGLALVLASARKRNLNISVTRTSGL